jgi:hypothetical protein
MVKTNIHHSTSQRPVFKYNAKPNANEYTKAQVTARDGKDEVFALQALSKATTQGERE